MFAVQSPSRSSKPIVRGAGKEGLQERPVVSCTRRTSGIGAGEDHGRRDGVFEASSSLLKVPMARKFSFSLRCASPTLSFPASFADYGTLQHTSLLHLIDARTFETEQIVRIPDPTISCLRNSGRPGHRSTRSESAISAIPMTNSAGLHLLDGPFTSDEELDDGGVVVVPRLGSTREEEDVSRLLRRHGLRTTRTRLRSARRRSESQQDGDGDMEMTDVDEQGDRDDMEVDELDTECLSSAAGSRAASPTSMATYAPPSHTFSSPSRTTPTLSTGPPYVARRPRGTRTINPVTTSSMTSLRVLANASRARRQETLTEESPKPEDTLDLAGVCFDPTGSHVYVGSSKGIIEYRIKGAEKTWWSSTEWA